jgi:hypothetical protein
MSAASTPAPRAKSSSESRPSGPRYSLFWPLLILLIGLGAREAYQVMAMEEQIDVMTQSADRLDAKVKLAQYEKAKFYTLASEVLHLAPHDPNANQVSVLFGLAKLQADRPELMNVTPTTDLTVPSTAATNGASATAPAAK